MSDNTQIKNPEIDQKPKGEVQARAISGLGEKVSLKDWVNVSWFFPKDFRLIKTLETEMSLVAVGEDKAYRFLKPFLEPKDYCRDEFLNRLERLIREYELNKDLSGDLYKGVAIIQWYEEDPYWLDQFSWKDFPKEISKHLRKPFIEPVLIMDRLKDSSRLQASLSRGVSRVEKLVEPVAETLVSFHIEGAKEGKLASKEDPYFVSKTIWNNFKTLIDPIYRSRVAYLDPFSQIIYGEAKSFLERELYELENLIFERGKQGFSVPIHGKLWAKNVFAQLGTESPIIKGRRFSLLSDVLTDVASFTVDLQKKGHKEAAKTFEDHYFHCYPEAYDKRLYNLLCVYNSLVRFLELYLPSDSADKELLDSQKFLSIAYEKTLRVPLPAIIVLTGSEFAELSAVAESLIQLLPADFISTEDLPALTADEPGISYFTRILDRSVRSLKSGKSVIAIWPKVGFEEQGILEFFSSTQAKSHLLVFLEDGKIEAALKQMTNSSSRSYIFEKQNRSFSPNMFSDINYTFIEPCLGESELVRTIVRELERLNI